MINYVIVEVHLVWIWAHGSCDCQLSNKIVRLKYCARRAMHHRRNVERRRRWTDDIMQTKERIKGGMKAGENRISAVFQSHTQTEHQFGWKFVRITAIHRQLWRASPRCDSGGDGKGEEIEVENHDAHILRWHWLRRRNIDARDNMD